MGMAVVGINNNNFGSNNGNGGNMRKTGAPASFLSLGKVSSGGITLTSQNGTVIKRIHTPHPHDVLCGRGGGINSHPGNRTFRKWVHERKEAYNLAPSKAAKAKVSREILEIIKSLQPSGRFLSREEGRAGPPGATFWVEIDDAKAMAKTSQALREGAPAIRSRAKQIEEEREHLLYQALEEEEPEDKPPEDKPVTRPNKKLKIGRSSGSLLTQNLFKKANKAISQLKQEDAAKITLAPPLTQIPIPTAVQHKKQKTDANTAQYSALSTSVGQVDTPDQETPSLVPVSSPTGSILNSQDFSMFMSTAKTKNPSPNKLKRPLQRANSLALSDLDTDSEDRMRVLHSDSTFNDPFAGDDDDISNDHNLSSAIEGHPNFSAVRCRILRQANSTLGGSTSGGGKSGSGKANSTLDRSTSGGGSTRLDRSTSGGGSTRSAISDLSDLPDAYNNKPIPKNWKDWNEGIKEIKDATACNMTDVPTYLSPYKNNNHKYSMLLSPSKYKKNGKEVRVATISSRLANNNKQQNNNQ